MLNWEMEFKKWCPGFKLLTYYGPAKERKAKRQGWSKPNAFHVCITSYTLVLQDAKMFRRKKWRYLILVGGFGVDGVGGVLVVGGVGGGVSVWRWICYGGL